VTLVVGIDPDGRGRAATELGGMLARSAGEDLVLCAVLPSPWPPSPARVDAEYQAHLERVAQETLREAGARLPGDVRAETVLERTRSAPAGLLEVAERVDAGLIAIASSPAGPLGRVVLGSVSARLMHSSPRPVALAPRGFRAREGARVTRVTAAYGGSDDDLVLAAAGVTARVGATLRIASFAVQPRPPYTSGVGRESEGAMLAEWKDEIGAAARAALDRVQGLPVKPADCEVVVGRGEDWDAALDDIPWGDGDVLVVGSSSMGPIARVFLGSRSSKIVRHSPVPVVVVPRGAAADLAEEAATATT
jgi:nucleotide-binding universal stress UspA family protein